MIAGVDYDSFGIYVATLWDTLTDEFDEHTARFYTLKFRKRHGKEAKADFAFEAALRLPGLITSEIPVPWQVAVERGKAPPGMQKSQFGLGRVQGIIVATFAHYSGPPAILEIPTSEWKIACAGKGYGNAAKDVVHERFFAERWQGEIPDDENMRDALCIAYAARELDRSASR